MPVGIVDGMQFCAGCLREFESSLETFNFDVQDLDVKHEELKIQIAKKQKELDDLIKALAELNVAKKRKEYIEQVLPAVIKHLNGVETFITRIYDAETGEEYFVERSEGLLRCPLSIVSVHYKITKNEQFLQHHINLAFLKESRLTFSLVFYLKHVAKSDFYRIHRLDWKKHYQEVDDELDLELERFHYPDGVA